MSRENKKTRIRGLSPKLYLNAVDNKTGSVPSISRISSDNRTGRYPVAFDDTKVVNFHSSGSHQKTLLGSTMPVRFSENDMVAETFGKDFFKAGFSDEFGPGHPLLIMHYDFDNNTRDKSGRGYHLNPYSGSIQYGPGPTPYSKAALFDGTVSLTATLGTAGIGEHLVSSPTASYTFEYVCKLRTNNFSLSAVTGSIYSAIATFGTASSGGSNDFYFIVGNDINYAYSLPTNRLVSSYGLPGVGGPPASYDNINLGINEEDMWHHYAYVAEYVSGTSGLEYDLRFYFDGELVQERTFVSGSLWNIDGGDQILFGDLFYLGTGPGINARYHGHISDFRLIETALDDEQIKRSAHRSLYGSDLYLSSGSVVKGVSDTHMSFTPGQEITPFVDSDNPASDGKSYNDPFYATGSAVDKVGEGFDGPVWSKTKIEIDLTPSVEHSFGIENFTSNSNNYMMAYWNKDLKQFQGVGSGDEFDLAKYKRTDIDGLIRFLDEKASAFPGCLNGPVLNDALIEKVALEVPNGAYNMFAPATTFGFPNHSKYEATASSYIEMSEYIDSPFLLEKIVLIFSGSFNINNYALLLPYTSSACWCASTFFLVNQWNNYSPPSAHSVNIISQSSPGVVVSSSLVTGSVERSKHRDLVTWAQMMYFNDRLDEFGIDDIAKNVMKEHQGIVVPEQNWLGKYVLSGSVVNPKYYASGNLMQVHGTGSSSVNGDAKTIEFFTGWEFYGRNMTKNTTRNYLNVIEQNKEVASLNSMADFSLIFPNSYASTPTFDFLRGGAVKAYAKINPYILKPGDQLIVGWEVPWSHHEQNQFGKRCNETFISFPAFVNVPVYDGLGPKLTFYPSPSKLILYGSKISQGKEAHDTTNQILTSMAVKEAIG